jgi:ribosomal protein L44E
MNKNIPTFKAKKISETQVQFTCSKCKRKLQRIMHRVRVIESRGHW